MKPLPTFAFTSFLLFMLILGMLLVASSSANFFPDPIPAGIQITSGGTVTGTNLIQRNGDVYTLTGDIYCTIVILRDGIVLDGGGYTLRGSGSGAGVFLQERSNVVIQNMRIVNFAYGVKFTWLNYGQPTAARSNTVTGSTFINNTYGIALYDFSEGNQISDNYFENNTYGIGLSSPGNNVLRRNQFWNNAGSIFDSGANANDIDTSNTVNGKPVCYWVNQHDKTVPSGTGWVMLKNCSGITVQGLNLAGNVQGVLLHNTNDSTISGNVITNNLEGIALRYSHGNVISSNRISNNNGYGISLEYVSNSNIITKNEIANNAKDGVNFGYYTINATVTENHVTGNGGNGIFFHDIQDSTVAGNNATLNKGCGIGFGYGPGIITENNITGNNVGIWLSNANKNTITWNNITENTGWGIRLEGSQGNNTIHHNNFINNSITEALQASVLGIWTYPGLNKPPRWNTTTPIITPTPEPEMPKFAPGNSNFWDDGKEGNYWSDYAKRYPNATEIRSTGVGDTPYFINENNADRYPLMRPAACNSNSTAQQQESEEFAEASLPVDNAVAVTAATATVIGILTASAYLLLKRKHSTA
ncbi:MAG: right-handed parallel beta-helix repeat-containing protein [Candidatus Bathyarchaeota archaeon]|nr:right-handed parallel beta-helix repeat-containing protein [Candidatus Bathyarchaeota archaeon]